MASSRVLTLNKRLEYDIIKFLMVSNKKIHLGIDISNSYVIIDEAHNVEKICEESASLTIKSTDIALCIEEVSWVMAGLSEDLSFTDTPKDISADELMQLKEIFLNFEKVFLEVEIGNDAKTYDGDYLLEMLDKAGVRLISWFSKRGFM